LVEHLDFGLGSHLSPISIFFCLFTHTQWKFFGHWIEMIEKKKLFFNPPYSRHQKIADSFYSGKIEVYKSKSTSDIIEISTMD